ncbi:MAG: hypothetical protein AAFN70_19625 [Planctomycetota bacterium]
MPWICSADGLNVHQADLADLDVSGRHDIGFANFLIRRLAGFQKRHFDMLFAALVDSIHRNPTEFVSNDQLFQKAVVQHESFGRAAEIQTVKRGREWPCDKVAHSLLPWGSTGFLELGLIDGGNGNVRRFVRPSFSATWRQPVQVTNLISGDTASILVWVAEYARPSSQAIANF